MRARLAVTGLLTLSTLLAVSACGGDDDEAESANTASTVVSGDESTDDSAVPVSAAADDGECTADRAGGSVTVGVYSETPSLDPIKIFGAGVAGGIETSALFDRLMVWDPETGEFMPHVARSLQPNRDFTEWTLTLRPNIEFGNGDPLTADAVKFSIERTQTTDNVSPSQISAETIRSVDVVDELTVRFRLTQAWAGFPALLADEAGMVVNPAVVKSMTPEDFGVAPVGAGVGPYEPERFQPGEEIVLKAKDDYWGGPVCIDELRFVWIPGGQGTWDAFRNDELDVAIVRDPRIVEEATSSGTNIIGYVQNLGDMLVFNNAEGHPTSDVRVRQAIAHAIDVEAVDQRVTDGNGSPTSAIIGEASRHYTGAEGPAYDPDEARRLLSKSKADGYDGSLEVVCDNTRTDAALAIEAQLRAVGFDVELSANLDVADHIQRIRVDKAFDVTCYGWNVNDTSPWLRLVPKIGPDNTGEASYDSDAMTAALDELRLAATSQDEQRALASVQDVWNREVPGMGLATIDESVVWSDSVKGLTFTAKTVVLFGDAYIED